METKLQEHLSDRIIELESRCDVTSLCSRLFYFNLQPGLYLFLSKLRKTPPETQKTVKKSTLCDE